MSIKKVHKSRCYTWKTKRKKKEDSFVNEGGCYDVLNFKPCFSDMWHVDMCLADMGGTYVQQNASQGKHCQRYGTLSD